ncbi:MAG: basic membrane protein A [Candidatus Aldehydirespiratoraceae bacterium]|jgi:basic membrane protein A
MLTTQKIQTSKRRRWQRMIAGVAALTLVATACGSDDAAEPAEDAAPETVVEEAETETTEAVVEEEVPEEEVPEEDVMEEDVMEEDVMEGIDLDTNGDGTIQIGVATPGPRDDGAYYQALVEWVEGYSADKGYADPIIVDNVDPAQAETELRNLARQGVDVITIGAGEISEPLATLTSEFEDIFWYCNCGATGQIDGVAQSADDGAEISYSAGYATGLLLQETESTDAVFLGCCELDFEAESSNSFALGLAAVDPTFVSTYIPTGDFNDIAGATEAFNQAVANGAGAVYPFLGGAHEAIAQLANEADVITMSAGASDVCERDDINYQIAVQFDAGDYLDVIFDKIAAGELNEGETFTFRVGAFDFVGAKFCGATDEQTAALVAANATLANGDLDGALYEIKAAAYGF